MQARENDYDVAVLGAGVFGVCTAWYLRQAGQRVLLVDPYGPASARASSGGETRVVRASYGGDEIYSRYAKRALLLWKQIFQQLGCPDLLRSSGVLWLHRPESAVGAQSLAVLAALDIAHERLDHADLHQRYPQLRLPESIWAILEPEGGALLARRAVQQLAAELQRGGVIFYRAAIAAVRGSGRLDAVVDTAGVAIRARNFVFACGPWLGKVLPDLLAGRIFPTRQEVYYFGTPAADSRFTIEAMPVWLDFDRDYYGIPDIDGRGFKIAHDVHGGPIDPDLAERGASPERIAAARSFLGQRFPALADAPLIGAEVCQYENTSSGDLIVDRHPQIDNAWIVGGGSGHGFKHGPAIGEHAAQRVLGRAAAEPRFALAGKLARQDRQVH